MSRRRDDGSIGYPARRVRTLEGGVYSVGQVVGPDLIVAIDVLEGAPQSATHARVNPPTWMAALDHQEGKTTLVECVAAELVDGLYLELVPHPGSFEMVVDGG